MSHAQSQANSELLAVTWATSLIMAACGSSLTAVALLCKASQWCSRRCRSRRQRIRRQVEAVAALKFASQLSETSPASTQSALAVQLEVIGEEEQQQRRRAQNPDSEVVEPSSCCSWCRLAPRDEDQGSRTSVYSFDDFVQRSLSQSAAAAAAAAMATATATAKDRAPGTVVASGEAASLSGDGRKFSSQQSGTSPMQSATAATAGDEEAACDGACVRKNEFLLNPDYLSPERSGHSGRNFDRFEMEWPPAASNMQSPYQSRLNLDSVGSERRTGARRGHIIFGRSFAKAELIGGPF